MEQVRQIDELKNWDVPIANVDEINELLRRYGVKFGIYKNGVFKEQLFPFDPIPRIITAQDFAGIEKGLIQRVDALNMFIYDIYHDKKIIADKVVPEDFVYISSGYLPQCEGLTPPKNIYSHISGIDLVLGKDGEWYILEDNLRIPSGASYPLIARELTRVASPKAFTDNPIVDNRNYAQLLRDTMDNVNCGGINAILTPGRYNAAYFEHSYLAELSGAALVSNDELFVENNILYRSPLKTSCEQNCAVHTIFVVKPPRKAYSLTSSAFLESGAPCPFLLFTTVFRGSLSQDLFGRKDEDRRALPQNFRRVS